MVLADKIIHYFAQKVRNRVVVTVNAQNVWEVEVMVFMVRWPIYETMLQHQMDQMLQHMRSPKFIFDCCDLIGDNEVLQCQFRLL